MCQMLLSQLKIGQSIQHSLAEVLISLDRQNVEYSLNTLLLLFETQFVGLIRFLKKIWFMVDTSLSEAKIWIRNRIRTQLVNNTKLYIALDLPLF